jgi:hypothetical protein
LFEGADDLREEMTLLALVDAWHGSVGAFPGFRASRA